MANWHINVVIGREVPGGTETEYMDLYVCDQHYATFSPLWMQPAGWVVLEREDAWLR